MERIGISDMTWYTASVVLAIEFDGQDDSAIPVFENFYLVEADSVASARAKAELLGQEEAAANQQLTFNDIPARFVFAGIRKIRSIYNLLSGDLDNLPPCSGTELSHSYYELSNRHDLKRFCDGGAVNVRYIDDAENAEDGS